MKKKIKLEITVSIHHRLNFFFSVNKDFLSKSNLGREREDM